MIKNKLRIIAVLSVLICVGLSILFLNNVETYSFKEDGKYYILGVEYDIPKGSKGKLTEEGEISLALTNKDVLEVSGIPVYLSSGKLVVMNKLSYYNPSFDGKFDKKKLNTFTEIEYNNQTSKALLTRNGSTKEENFGFLYDGHNTFVFLEETILTINDVERVLPPLSFVLVEYQNYAEIYNSQTKEFSEIDVTGDVFATNKTRDYKINVSLDTITFQGRDTIMISNIDAMSDYFLGD